jgi:hypothetical protein
MKQVRSPSKSPRTFTFALTAEEEVHLCPSSSVEGACQEAGRRDLAIIRVFSYRGGAASGF